MNNGKMTKWPGVIFCVAALCLMARVEAQADFSKRLSYQGRLTDTNGVPLANGAYDMTFKIYDASAAGTLLWSESHTGAGQVTVTNGLFSAVLGDTTTLNGVSFDGTEYWIEVAVGATTYSPRQRLTASAMSLNIPDGTVSTLKIVDSAVTNAKIADDAISTIKIQSSAVTNAKIANSAVSAAKILDGACLSEILDDDGTGSGLDCDTLDGLDWSNLTGTGSDYWVNVSGDTMAGVLNMGNYGITNIDWAASDDGTGSGLDADLLDGLHESSFFRLAENETVTGTPSFNGGTTGSSPPFSVDSTFVVTSLNADLLDGYTSADFQLRITGVCAAGSSIRAINADGTVTCETDDDTTDHGALGGLGDDDHPQYFALSQNEAVTGIPAFNGGTSGTSAPFSVDSNYKVTSLNADLLDGYDWTTVPEGTDVWVNETGDTMTGNLSIDYAGNPGIELRANAGGTSYVDWSNDAGSDYDARIRLTGDDLLYVEGTNLNLNNNYGIYMAGNSLGDDATRLYTTSSSNRLMVRAEDTDNAAQFAEYGLYLPSPLSSVYNLYTGNGIQTAYSAAANIDWRNGGNITTNSGAYTPVSFSSTSGYAHFGNGSGITMGDKPVYLRGSYGSDANHGILYNGTVDGPEMRGASGFIWKTGSAGATERMRLTSDPVLITGAVATNKFHTVIGPGTGADNQTHTVQCNAGYAIVNFGVYASNYWDGNITLTCFYLGGLINTGAAAWEDSSLETCDGCWHYATCGAGKVATGFRAYASGRIDTNLQLLCAPLTTSSYTSMSHWITSGNNDEANDDSMQGAMCPMGTFLYNMAVYAGSYPDGDLRIMCRAPIP